MSAIYKKWGLIKAGWLRVACGLDQLRAKPGLLVLQTSFQAYHFAPGDVVAFVPEHGLMGRLQIVHTVEDYPKSIFFWFVGDPDAVVAGIQNAGFRPDAGSTPPRQKREPKVVWKSEFPARDTRVF